MLTSPTAQEMAERIFAEMAGDAGDSGGLAALTGVYERLGQMMSVVVGDAGYRAILSRSLRKAAAAHPGVVLSESDAPFKPVLTRLQTEDPAAIRTAAIAIMTNFIELLGTLIGAELTLTLLDREWPRANFLISTERA
jgi:hypothetical protein